MERFLQKDFIFNLRPGKVVFVNFNLLFLLKTNTMKKTITLSLTLLVCNMAFSQYGELENSSFENWSLDTSYQELDQWTTSNFETGGLVQNVTDSSDAIDGNKSVYMQTTYFGQDTLVGYIMLGLPGQNGPGNGVSYTTPVDSIVGYWKYESMADDSITFFVQQKIAGVPVFLVKKFVGSQTGWQRFSFALPINTGQDSLTIAFAAGDAFNNYSVPGSWIMVDKVQLKSGSSYAPDIPNYSFENWIPITSENPNAWDSFNSATASLGVPTLSKTTDAYSGNYAAELTTKYVPMYDDTIMGIITKGPTLNVLSGMQGISYGATPANFEGYYKYSPVGNDTARFSVAFYSNNTMIGGTYFEVTSTSSAYVPFSEVLNLSTTPDSMAVAIMSGDRNGSSLIVDDINLSGGNVSVLEQDIKNVSIYPTVTNSFVTIEFDTKNSAMLPIQIYSVEGKLVYSSTNSMVHGDNKLTLDVSGLPKGNYILKIGELNHAYTSVITKQ